MFGPWAACVVRAFKTCDCAGIWEPFAGLLELISGLLPACTGVEVPPGRAIVRRMAGATGGRIWVS